ncbi:MAG: hypothetical protein IJX99_00835 [Clostridia bacterium]|nr:hypothetical protein [Clostridia bacterium]
MRQIRRGTFETNSSSTHAICISKEKIDKEELKGKKVHFGFGEFGWDFDRDVNIPNYIYTIICDATNEKNSQEYINKIKQILDKYGVEYSFEEPIWTKDGYLDFDCGYVDHADCTPMQSILADEELFLSLLFDNRSFVATGNDNSGFGEAYEELLGEAEGALKETHEIFWKGN